MDILGANFDLGKHRPNSTNVGRFPGRFGECWPDVDHNYPMLTNIGAKIVFGHICVLKCASTCSAPACHDARCAGPKCREASDSGPARRWARPEQLVSPLYWKRAPPLALDWRCTGSAPVLHWYCGALPVLVWEERGAPCKNKRNQPEALCPPPLKPCLPTCM